MNLQEQIRKILREETKLNVRLKRRISMLDYEVESKLRTVYRPNICIYKNGEELLDVVIDEVIDVMYFKYFSNTDDETGEWMKLYYGMVDYIKNKYGNKIKEYYHINCGD